MKNKCKNIAEEIALLHQETEDSYLDIWTKLEIDISFQLDDLLKKKGLKRKDLAKKMGTSSAYITKILRGDANFTLETLAKLAHSLDVDIKVSLEEKGKEKRAHLHNFNSCLIEDDHDSWSKSLKQYKARNEEIFDPGVLYATESAAFA